MTTLPRGVRNRNPGNLERNTINWQGMARVQTDPRFVVFEDAKYGIRALARTLLTYQHAHGCDTIGKIIGRWAPPTENDTVAYIAAVAARCGVAPDDVIDADQVSVMLPLVAGIISHENGGNPYTDNELLAGLHLAGIADAPPPVPTVVQAAPAPSKPTVASTTMQGGALGLLATYIPQFAPPLLAALHVPADAIQDATNSLVQAVGLVAALLVFYGRMKATHKLT
jgi:hypothetical protein